MSIPLDRLYHYIESVAQDVYGDVLIYHFYPHGSKNIEDLKCLSPHTLEEFRFNPYIICYDQEPLNYNLYKNTPVRLSKNFDHVDPSFFPKRNLRVIVGNVYDKCILLHSERSSNEVNLYQQNHFIPVYYWSHAIIARDWFRYAEHTKFTKNIKKTFLIYNRAWSGTREYRLKFTDLILENKLIDYCKINFNPYDHDFYYKNHQFSNNVWQPLNDLEQYFSQCTAISSFSADFDISDYNTTEFEVVLETLFDDQRQHLTEKTLRPIACRQPFILASTPGSLKYLRNYGFQTFGDIFNESYDTIEDPVARMNSIIETMNEIMSWSDHYKIEQMTKIDKITEFNQNHFFSNEFFSMVTNELKNNLKTGLNYVETTNFGSHFFDPKIKNIPGMREYRKNHPDRIALLQKIKAYRKQNRRNKY